MSILSLLAPSFLTGCVMDCPNCVTTDQLDQAVADGVEAALAEKGCLTEEAAAALYLTPEAADASYASVAYVDSTIADFATVDYVDSAIETCATDVDIEAVNAEVALLGAEVATVSAIVVDHETRLVALEDADLDGRVTALEDIDSDGRLAAIEADYLTSSSLSGYATESWVTGAALSGYATESWVTGTALVGYATESWVTSQGFATQVDVDSGDAALSGSIVALDARMTDAEGDVAGLTTDLGDLSDSAVTVLTADKTWSVSTVTGLQSALDDLSMLRIPAGVRATISLAAGTYVMTDELRIEHADGARIAIVGNVTTPSAVVLRFTGNGVELSEGQALGYLGGVTLDGPGAASATTYTGLTVSNSAALAHGPLVITDFNLGVSVSRGAALTNTYSTLTFPLTEGNITIESCANGMYAEMGGSVATYPLLMSDITRYGLLAMNGGSVAATYSTFDDIGSIAVWADRGSEIHVDGATISGVTAGTGIEASNGGIVSAEGADISTTQYGISVSGGGFVNFVDGDASTTLQGVGCEGGSLDAYNADFSGASSYDLRLEANCSIDIRTGSYGASSVDSWSTSSWIVD